MTRRLHGWMAGTVVVVGALGAASTGVLAQERPVPLQGRVLDRVSGAPLEGAFVSFEGTNQGVFTDARGLFYLPRPSDDVGRVTIELLGYGLTLVPPDLLAESPPIHIPLKPDPVLLEGFEVVSDRFQRRRNAAPMSVRAFEPRHLRAASPSMDVMQFLESRAFIQEAPCFDRFSAGAAARAAPGGCARIRGRTQRVTLCVDEVPMYGGLYVLRSFSPAELALLEVYGSGRMIRVYTQAFMEKAARIRLNPQPAEFGC